MRKNVKSGRTNRARNLTPGRYCNDTGYMLPIFVFCNQELLHFFNQYLYSHRFHVFDILFGDGNNVKVVKYLKSLGGSLNLGGR